MIKNYVDILVGDQYIPEEYELTWAKKNCPSYITNDAVQKQGVYYYRYYFGNEKDAMMFMLRWS